MKYYVIAGEASGDLHASNLLRELKKKDPQAEVRAWGGDLLKAQGAQLVKHYRELAFMGFKEVIANLGTIMRNIRFCKEDITAFQPDVIIFVDYPGFNMRIAGWARKAGFRTVYYISPQIWAWKAGRALKLKRDIDQMIVILPFEKNFYRKYDYQVEYVGHPLLDVIANFTPDPEFSKVQQADSRPVVALLPGSRKQEILKKLPVMLAVRSEFPEYRFIVAGAPGQEESFYRQICGEDESVSIVFGKTYDILSIASAALVTSGTATLETALFEVPEVVCYKGSAFSYAIGKRLVKVAFISLVNLIMGRLVVKELIQDEMNEKNLTKELHALLEDQAYRQTMKENFKELKQKLGGQGASARAAEIIYNFLQKA
jgi:lipid-A-disaccharide synthase